jgi:hypothetical protein
MEFMELKRLQMTEKQENRIYIERVLSINQWKITKRHHRIETKMAGFILYSSIKQFQRPDSNQLSCIVYHG